MKKKTMRRLLNVVFALMFLAGFLILAYPTISDQWNTYRQSRLISSYEETVSTLEPEDFSDEWAKAQAFNDTLTENNIYGDVFTGEDEEIEDTECGLSAGIFTKDPKVIDRFRSEVDVPSRYINESSRVLMPAATAKLGNFCS